MPETPIYDLPYPSTVGVAPDVPYWMQQAMEAVEARLAAQRWTDLLVSATSYNFAVVGAARQTITSGAYTVPAVPAGRQLQVQFSAPLVNLQATTGLRLYLRLQGTDRDGAYFSNSDSTAFGVPARLEAVHAGTGADVLVQVDALREGTGNPEVRASDVAPVRLRYRIV